MRNGVQPLVPAFEDCQRSERTFGGTIAFAAGGDWQVQVPVDALTERIIVRLDLAVTIGGSPTNYVAYPFNAAEMLRSIQLEVGSLGQKKNMTGLDYWLLAAIRDRSAPHMVSLTTAQSNAADTYNISCEFPIHLASFGVAPQFLGTLVTKSQTQVLLRGTFGNTANLVHTGTGGTHAYSGTLSFRRNNIHPRTYDAGGYGHLVEMTQDLAIATTADYEITLQAWRRMRSLTVLTRDLATPTLADTLLTALKLRYESANMVYDVRDEDLRGHMFTRYGVPTTFHTGAALDWCGIYHIEFGKTCPGLPGSIRSYLDGREASQLTAILSLTAGTTATAHIIQTFWED